MYVYSVLTRRCVKILEHVDFSMYRVDLYHILTVRTYKYVTYVYRFVPLELQNFY
jgi:hypothetical protein